MYRSLFKFVVTTLTILTAELVASYFSLFLVSYKYEFKPLRFTFLAMGIITVVFYPLFMKLEEWLNRVSKKFVKAGHSFAGKYIGLLLMFVVGIFILLYFYAKLWYNINIFQMLLHGRFFKAL